MPAHLHALARSAAVIAIVLCATPARAQSEEGSGTSHHPSNLQFLLGTEAILHSADMFTTAYDLQLSGSARERNPLLAPLSRRPLALVTVSSAVNVLQLYTITRLNRNHPKLAMAWALILIGTETYAVTNNIKVAGQLRRAGAGTR